MIRLTKVRQPTGFASIWKYCQSCDSLASVRLTAVSLRSTAITKIDLCDSCAGSAAKQIDARKQKRALKKILG
jgi:protein-arginine kinase activator protein McsA